MLFFFTSSFPHRLLRVQPLPELLSFFLFSSSTTAVFSGADGDGGNIPLSESSAQARERSSHCYLLLGNQLCLVRLFTRQRQPRGGGWGGAANTHLCNTKKVLQTHTCVHAHTHTLQPRPVLMSLDGNKVPIHPGGSPGSLAPAARDPAGRRLHCLLLPPPRGAGQSCHSLLLLLLYQLSTWQKTTCRISQKTLSWDQLKVCRFMHVWRLFKNKLTLDVKLQIAKMHLKSKYYA